MAASASNRLVLTGAYGLAWGVGGFLLTPFLQKIGPAKLRSCASASPPS